MNQTFEAIRLRTAVRKFSPVELSETLVAELLTLANQAPSGFNLQPWYFVIVKDINLRRLLQHIALGQAQVIEAPITVVFAADPEIWSGNYPKFLRQAFEAGKIPENQFATYNKNVPLIFRTGPLGLFGLAKRLALPMFKLFKPTGTPVTSRQERIAYVRAQTMLAAATFMIAAKSAGLETSPMEGFDEDRLKKLLAIPARFTVPVIVPIGYPLEKVKQPTARMPIGEKLSLDLFPNKVKQ